MDSERLSLKIQTILFTFKFLIYTFNFQFSIVLRPPNLMFIHSDSGTPYRICISSPDRTLFLPTGYCHIP